MRELRDLQFGCRISGNVGFLIDQIFSLSPVPVAIGALGALGGRGKGEFVYREISN